MTQRTLVVDCLRQRWRLYRTMPVVTVAAILVLASSARGQKLGEAASPARRATPERAEFEAIAESLYAGDNRYLGRATLDRYLASVAETERPVAQRLSMMNGLVGQYLRFGDYEAAKQLVARALAMARKEGNPDLVKQVLFVRGLTYLRVAEAQNCVGNYNSESCLLPLRGGGVHSDRRPAQLALESFEEHLTFDNPNRVAPWLLNIVAMAAGVYPERVPEVYRVPPEALASEADIGWFDNISMEAGVAAFNQCGGVAAQDFDDDGLVDIVTSTFDPRGSLIFYRNAGDKGFVELSAESGLDGQLGGLNLVAADFDDDGDVDLFVLRGAWLRAAGEIRNSLLRNNGDLTFSDVTREAGLADPAMPTQAAAWADFDNDGDLDLYIANESPWEEREKYPSQLFRNNGDGTFTDIAAEAGVLNHGFGKAVATGDFDNDGQTDIYVSNIGPNRLYRNQGEMKFVDVAPELGLTEPERRSFASWFFDFDNDGWLDLFVGNYQASVLDVVADLMGESNPVLAPRLYHNNGDGTFTDIAEATDLAHAYMPMGANFGDFDNDGWLDFYLSTGDPRFVSLVPNVALRNDAGRRFQNVSTSAGLGHLQKGHGVAFADFDNDGDQDIYHQLGGFYPSDAYHNALFRNPGHGNHFLTVELQGVKSNSHGLGARIRVAVTTPRGPRELHRTAGAVSSFGGSVFRQEIGLADAERIDALEVYWPVSGERQVFDAVPLDSAIRVTEGQEQFEVLVLPSFDLPDPVAARSPMGAQEGA